MATAQGTITGRCYCGHVTVTAAAPRIVTYCHCSDCKRWTGSPLPAFAACPDETVRLSPDIAEVAFPSGVSRRNCSRCGSPLTARFPYLPGQTYLPLGILDDPETTAPTMHSHANAELSWLHLDDGLPRPSETGRARLNDAFQ